MVCWRAKASSWRVISAERWAALWISLRASCTGEVGSTLFQGHLRVAQHHPEGVVEIVRHPAQPSRPTDSIFCAWASWPRSFSRSASDCLRSVMSWMIMLERGSPR